MKKMKTPATEPTQVGATTSAKDSNTKSQNIGINIIWDSNLGNGVSPDGPITLNNGEIMQLSYEFLDGNTFQEGYQINWYTNDQQIVQAYWDGKIKAQWIGTWFGPTYPNTTIISLFCYRPNPKYDPNKPKSKQWLDPYQDYIVVKVEG
jgi:hypothetical protein